MRHLRPAAVGLLLCAALAPGTSALTSSQAYGNPVLTTPHFVFFSDLPTNLNDALVAAGGARNTDAAEMFGVDGAAACFGDLAPSARAGWRLAVDYYAEIVSPASWNDRQQFLLRLDLAGVDLDVDEQARQFLDVAAGLRAAATPAYTACRWEGQDAANRRWAEILGVLLAEHESEIAARLERLYEKPWDGLPIRVDVVETVNAQGANSVFLDPAGGHLLLSRSFAGSAALEVVFHEASHLLMRRNDPVQRALTEAAAAQDVPVPDDLWHVVLFYTTGETVRRVLADAGDSSYRPMLFEIFERGSWARYREPLEITWPAFLDGERTLSQAAGDLIDAIVEVAADRPSK